MSESAGISREDLNAAIEAAYRKGAEDLSAMLGLPADKDKRSEFVRSLHQAVGFVEAIQEAKRVAVHAAIKWATVAVILFVAGAIGFNKLTGK